MKQATAIKFKSGMEINVIGHGKGRVTGNVGSPMPIYVRVQFESGDIRDFLPRKLAAKLIPETK